MSGENKDWLKEILEATDKNAAEITKRNGGAWEDGLGQQVDELKDLFVLAWSFMTKNQRDKFLTHPTIDQVLGQELHRFKE